MLTSSQCRAARGLLAWSQQKLAIEAAVGLSSVRDLETERRTVSGEMTEAIRKALEKAGVIFIDENGGGCGVRMAKRSRSRKV